MPDARTTTGPPDFVGIGAWGSGARWWHESLLRHPSIAAPRGGPDPVRFFTRFCADEMTDADVADYHARFPRGPGEITGEWTPRYAYDAWTPRLLRRAAPDARLLMLVSDPFERYVDRLSLKVADPEQLFMADADGRCRYAAQLRNVLAYFSRDRVLVLQHEQCLRDPAGQYARTLRFLGVTEEDLPPTARPVAEGEPVGVRRRARRALGLLKRRLVGAKAEPPSRVEPWPDLERALIADLEPDVRRLRAIAPDLDLALWPRFAHLAA